MGSIVASIPENSRIVGTIRYAVVQDLPPVEFPIDANRDVGDNGGQFWGQQEIPSKGCHGFSEFESCIFPAQVSFCQRGIERTFQRRCAPSRRRSK